MRISQNNGSYSVEVEENFLSRSYTGMHDSYSLRQQCIRSVYYSYTLLQHKKEASNRSQSVAHLALTDICGDFMRRRKRITFFLPSLVVVFAVLCTSARIFIDWIYLFCVFFFGRVLKFQLIINYIWSKFVIWAPRDRSRVASVAPVESDSSMLALALPPK